MTNTSFVIVGLLAVVGLIVVGVLAGQVGGETIRSNPVRATTVTLLVNQPVQRGVQVTVQWDPGKEKTGLPKLFCDKDLRSAQKAVRRPRA